MHENTIKGGNNMRFKDARALHKGDEVTLKGPNTTDGVGYRSAGKTGFPHA